MANIKVTIYDLFCFVKFPYLTSNQRLQRRTLLFQIQEKCMLNVKYGDVGEALHDPIKKKWNVQPAQLEGQQCSNESN